MEATEGQRVTTRYFGGYESVQVKQIHPTYYVVSRFGEQTTDILPKDQVARAFDANGSEVFCSETEKAREAMRHYGEPSEAAMWWDEAGRR